MRVKSGQWRAKLALKKGARLAVYFASSSVVILLSSNPVNPATLLLEGMTMVRLRTGSWNASVRQ